MSATDLIKGRIDYPALLRTLGIPFEDHGGEGALYFRCLNPKHEDTSPSMKVQYRARGSAPVGHWRCWNGACRRWGKDVIDLVRVMRRFTYGEALGWLTEFVGGISGKDLLAVAAAEQVRGIEPQESGVVMPFPSLLPEPNVMMRADHPYFRLVRKPPVNGERAVEEGAVLVTGGEYSGYMAVPIRWYDGNVVTFQVIAVEPDALERRAEWARRFSPRLSVKAKLYPPKAPTDRILYGSHRVRPGSVVVVSEGIFDTWRNWDALEPRGATAVGALSNRFTAEQGDILLSLHPQEVVVIPDNDPNPGGEVPGDRLVLDVVAALAYSVPVSVATLPPDEDPDSAGVEAIVAAWDARVQYGGWVLRYGTAPRPRVSLADVLDKPPTSG